MNKLGLRLRIARLTRRFSRQAQQRGGVIRRIAKAFELVYFGTVYYDDDVTPIKGFTLSTTYIDQHFCVGQFDGYEIRMVDRYDNVSLNTRKSDAQNWFIIEITLEHGGLPRTCLVPTGQSAKEYTRFFTSHTKFQPLNTTVFQNHSSELHGRFQIIASPSRTDDVERMLSTPIVMGIAARFWPHGLEIYKNKLYVYVTDHRLTRSMVSTAVESALWLAEALDTDAANREED